MATADGRPGAMASAGTTVAVADAASECGDPVGGHTPSAGRPLPAAKMANDVREVAERSTDREQGKPSSCSMSARSSVAQTTPSSMVLAAGGGGEGRRMGDGRSKWEGAEGWRSTAEGRRGRGGRAMGKGGGGGKSAAKGKRGKTAEGKGARVGLWKSGGQQGGGGGVADKEAGALPTWVDGHGGGGRSRRGGGVGRDRARGGTCRCELGVTVAAALPVGGHAGPRVCIWMDMECRVGPHAATAGRQAGAPVRRPPSTAAPRWRDTGGGPPAPPRRRRTTLRPTPDTAAHHVQWHPLHAPWTCTPRGHVG